MDWSTVGSLLLGRDAGRTRRHARLAVASFGGGLGLWGVGWLLDALDVAWGVDGAVLLRAIALASVGPAALAADRNDGLLGGWALGAGLGYGLVAGSLGFAIGAGGRRVRARFGGWSVDAPE